MAKENVEDTKAAYEKELEQELHKIISELSNDPESTIVKCYSFTILCGIRRHLNQSSTIPEELKMILGAQITREIHDCILEIYMYCKTYEDVNGIISQTREEDQPTVKRFLEDIQREVALKRLNAVLVLIKSGQYVEQLNNYSLEELCELERYLIDCETNDPEDKTLIDTALQKAINHKIGLNPYIYKNANRMKELIERANPIDRPSLRTHIESYIGKRFAISPKA